MLAYIHILRLLEQIQKGGDQCRNQDDADHSQGPKPDRRKRRPAQQQKKHQPARRQTAPKIVEDFPARQPGKRILPEADTEAGNGRQQPSRNLPIASNPAPPAGHVRAVAGRIFLV